MDHDVTQILTACDRALDGMTQILLDLGDGLAQARPALPGANTPVAIVTHCLGVVDHWVGRLVGGRDLARDRDAEFRAAGPVDELVARVRATQRALRQDVTTIDPAAPFRLPTGRSPRDWPTTQGGALVHALEELAQHHGQLEMTRDLLRAGHVALHPSAP